MTVRQDIEEIKANVTETRLLLWELRKDVADIANVVRGAVLEQMETEEHNGRVPIPLLFPCRKILYKAGIFYVDEIPLTAKRLKAIDGIGAVEASRILHVITQKPGTA